MNLFYGVTINDYINKTIKIIRWCSNKYDALNICEELAYNYIYSKIGYTDDIKIYNKYERNRPFTYFIYRDTTKHLEKLKIKHKQLNKGYFYNDAIIKTLCSFYITESVDIDQNIYFYNNEFTLKDKFNNVISEFKNLKTLKE